MRFRGFVLIVRFVTTSSGVREWQVTPTPSEYLTLFSPREMGSLVVCLSLSPPSAIYVHPVE